LLAAASIALVAAILFGLGSRGTGPAASGSESPDAASGSAARATGSVNPSALSRSSGPSASPTAVASQGSGAAAATVLATIPNCSPHNSWLYAASGEDLYVVCYDAGTSLPYVARLSMGTNKVVATYRPDPAKLIYTYIDHVAVDGGQLWLDGSQGSGCLGLCPGFNQTVRIDPATGNTNQYLSGWVLKGDGLGYVWAADQNGQVFKLDPATGAEKGSISFTSQTLEVACGSLWGLTVNGPSTAPSTTIARLDPASGNVLATFTETGLIGGMQQVGAQCWAPALSNPDSEVGYGSTEVPDFNHFDRIGQSSIEFRSPRMPWSQGCAAIFNGTFWLLGNYYIAWLDPTTNQLLATMQQIDPATWNPTGTIWTYVGMEPVFGAGGSLWAADSRDNAGSINRLSLP